MIGLAVFIAALAVQDGPDLTLYDRLYTGCAALLWGFTSQTTRRSSA